MVTADEEAQAKEFLKRAEIRTMKKDLLQLREADSLKERDKIAHIKTLEEQLEEQKKKNEANQSSFAKASEDKAALEEVLTKNEGQERLAEKDLKNYASEEEKQQIFLLESQRLALEKQVDAINKEKDPALKLEKNTLLLQKRDQQAKLNSILEQEKKLEDEQKFIAEKEQTTTIASQKKALEQSRGDIDSKIQEVEKKRWAVEKEIEETDAKVSQIDISSDQLVTEKNGLGDKILGADKSLRDIYSTVMAREEDRRRGKAQEQIDRREALSQARATENENVQRQQWSRALPPSDEHSVPGVNHLAVPIKRKTVKSFEDENEQRKKFIQDVEEGANK